ncbi:hypothetical protein ACJMK2_028494, partial [Sinanodonta woodiana]
MGPLSNKQTIPALVIGSSSSHEDIHLVPHVEYHLTKVKSALRSAEGCSTVTDLLPMDLSGTKTDSIKFDLINYLSTLNQLQQVQSFKIEATALVKNTI